MNAHTHIVRAALSFAIGLSALPALATDASTPPDPAAPDPPRLVIDCAHPATPSLRALADVAGEPNLVHADITRNHVMRQVHGACHRPGIRQVWVVRELPYQVADTAGPQTAATRRPAK